MQTITQRRALTWKAATTSQSVVERWRRLPVVKLPFMDYFRPRACDSAQGLLGHLPIETNLIWICEATQRYRWSLLESKTFSTSKHIPVESNEANPLGVTYSATHNEKNSHTIWVRNFCRVTFKPSGTVINHQDLSSGPVAYCWMGYQSRFEMFGHLLWWWS